jgi:putative membrane protein
VLALRNLGSRTPSTSAGAQQKAQNAWVKKFAEYEVAEQETIAEILRAEMPTASISGAEKHAKMSSDKKAKMIDELKSAKDGEFDRTYLKGHLEGHMKLLEIQETYIAKGKNKEHVNLAKFARGQVKEHIDLIQTIQRELEI